MEALQAMYPNITLPEPVAVHVSSWTSNPLYRGSYANWGPSYTPRHSQNLKATVNNRVWFAGEATSVKYFGVLCVQIRPKISVDALFASGLLQGAYFEGQNAGYALAACIQGNITSCDAFPRGAVPKTSEPYQSALSL